MTRRLILAALALFAFLALESCGVDRLAGPVTDARALSAQSFKKDHKTPQNPVPVQVIPVASQGDPVGDDQPLDGHR